MRALLIFSLFTALVTSSFGEILGDDSNDQKLRIYRHRVNIVDDLLKSECPNYTDKREIVIQNSISTQLEVEMKLYNTLIAKLIECRAGTSSSFPVISESTTASTTTTSTTTISTTTTPTTTTSTTTTITPTADTTAVPKYRDCQEYYEHGYNRSGVYELTPSNGNLTTFDVWCDFYNKSGWTVIQRRGNSSVGFNRTWSQYKEGFGDITGDHWLGNDRIHFLTQANQRLNIQLVLKNGTKENLYWKKFYIADESHKYKLRIDGSGYSGNLLDRFAAHNNMPFSTTDMDNDNWSSNSCAGYSSGAWWYDNCAKADLNRGDNLGIYLLGYPHPMRASLMRISRHL